MLIEDRPTDAVSMAIVEEFIQSWRAEVQEYDITPTGGTTR